MSPRTALARGAGAAALLVLPLLLWEASLRGALRRDAAGLARSDAAGRAEARERIEAFGTPGLLRLVGSLGGPAPIPVMNLLAGRGDAELIARLVEALDDGDEDVRHYAGMTLAFIGSDAVPALVETLSRSPVAHVRASAAWAFSCMGREGLPALPALQAALSDEDKDVRHVARYAIAQLSSGNESYWASVDRARAKLRQPPR